MIIGNVTGITVTDGQEKLSGKHNLYKNFYIHFNYFLFFICLLYLQRKNKRFKDIATLGFV